MGYGGQDRSRTEECLLERDAIQIGRYIYFYQTTWHHVKEDTTITVTVIWL
jgi:hypothetical protein